MPCLLIYGATGMGKTKISQEVRAPSSRKTLSDVRRDASPGRRGADPPEPVERDLYREMLVSLQAPALAGGSLAREKESVARFCARPECG